MSTEITDALGWLAAAAAVIWLGIGCYLALLGARQRGLSLRIRQMEQMRNNDEE